MFMELSRNASPSWQAFCRITLLEIS